MCGHPEELLGDTLFKIANPAGGFFGFTPLEDAFFPRTPNKLRLPKPVTDRSFNNSRTSPRVNRAAQFAVQQAANRSSASSTIATGPSGLNTNASTTKRLLGV